MGLWARTTEQLKLEPRFGCKAWSAKSTCLDVHPRGEPDLDSDGVCMACHVSGRENHPSLRENARDRLRLSRWQPPEGGDQWGAGVAEPTKYDPGDGGTDGKKRRRMKQFARSVDVASMSPDELSRRIESGHARVLA